MSNGLAKRELPKLDGLYGNIELAAKQNDLNKLLNCEPKKEWVKDYPMVSGVKYIPIGIVGGHFELREFINID